MRVHDVDVPLRERVRGWLRDPALRSALVLGFALATAAAAAGYVTGYRDGTRGR